MKRILLTIIVVIINSTVFAQKVYIFDLNKYVNMNVFKDNVQDNMGNYSGTYTCLLLAATDEMDANWDELIVESLNNEVRAFRIFYVEAEPQPSIPLLNVSINGNYFKAQEYNEYEKKYDNFSGRFVYLIESQSGLEIYGLLMKQMNINGQYELFFYSKK